jgi:CubicO group peptidase (beta-lactamase class C family)
MKYLSIPITIILLLVSCAPHPVRLNTDGTPQREYSYQIPLEIDDGWQVSSLAKEGVDEELITDMMTAVLAEKFPYVYSIVLVKNGKLVFEEYFYGHHRYLLQEFRSVGKSVTSELVGIAIDKGYIGGVDEKMLDYFPDFERGPDWDSRKDGILLHHVLSMTYGLDGSGPANSAAWYSENWIRDVLELPLVSEPGERFEYHSAAPALCGPIIEYASGMSVPDFANKYLYGPLDISHYDWWMLPDASVLTAGGLRMRPRDMAKFGYLILSKGQWRGKRVLSEEWIDTSTRAHASAGERLAYGYYWWLGKFKGESQPIQTIFASGFGGQKIFVLPELGLVVVITSRPDDNPEGHDRADRIMEDFVLPAM